MGLTIAISLVWQSPACRSLWPNVVAPLALWGTFAGGLGSLVRSTPDSIIMRSRLTLPLGICSLIRF